jgi:hypothetical protein
VGIEGATRFIVTIIKKKMSKETSRQEEGDEDGEQKVRIYINSEASNELLPVCV